MSGVFPAPETADENGIVCSGGDFSGDLLLEAYAKGIFPWPHEGHPLLWFSPDPRGVIYTEKAHLPKSLKKWMNQNRLKMTINQDFQGVISACQKQKRKDQGTWIDDSLKQGYISFHEAGFAYSVEGWMEEELVCGFYGVAIDRFFSAESMFFHVSNSSKALLYLFLNYLVEKDIKLLDCQMVTSTTELLGAEYIERSLFLEFLQQNIQKLQAPSFL